MNLKNDIQYGRQWLEKYRLYRNKKFQHSDFKSYIFIKNVVAVAPYIRLDSWSQAEFQNN